MFGLNWLKWTQARRNFVHFRWKFVQIYWKSNWNGVDGLSIFYFQVWFIGIDEKWLKYCGLILFTWAKIHRNLIQNPPQFKWIESIRLYFNRICRNGLEMIDSVDFNRRNWIQIGSKWPNFNPNLSFPSKLTETGGWLSLEYSAGSGLKCRENWQIFSPFIETLSNSTPNNEKLTSIEFKSPKICWNRSNFNQNGLQMQLSNRN